MSIPTGILDMIKPANENIIEQYKGRDNTTQVYTWEHNIYVRAFSNSRRLEALKKIREENERFEDICQRLRE